MDRQELNLHIRHTIATEICTPFRVRIIQYGSTIKLLSTFAPNSPTQLTVLWSASYKSPPSITDFTRVALSDLFHCPIYVCKDCAGVGVLQLC